MSKQQRASHLKKIAETDLTKSPPDFDVQDGAINQPLSINVHDTGLSVPQGIIDRIWKKASELLSTPGAMCFAPGLAPQACAVISKTHSGFHTFIHPFIIVSTDQVMCWWFNHGLYYTRKKGDGQRNYYYTYSDITCRKCCALGGCLMKLWSIVYRKHNPSST